MRKYLAFLLLGVLTVVGAGAAVLGAVQSSSGVTLGKAVSNTLSASGYTEALAEHTPQGDQSGHLVYQAPDRLGGWVQSGSQRTYLVIIGTTEYISVTQSAKKKRIPRVYYRQQSNGVQASDPLHTYLGYYNRGPATQSGNVTTVAYSAEGEKQLLQYTVNGGYVTNFHVAIQGSFINLEVSDIGSSPPVALPKGARIVAAPASGSSGSSSSGSASGG